MEILLARTAPVSLFKVISAIPTLEAVFSDDTQKSVMIDEIIEFLTSIDEAVLHPK